MTAESECVGQGNINFAFLCFIEREIKVIVDIFVVVTFFMVDSRVKRMPHWQPVFFTSEKLKFPN